MKRNLVDIPPKQIKLLKAKNSTYVYRRGKSYRDAEGKVKRETDICIGKYDPVQHKLIPNKNYYQLYNLEMPVENLEFEYTLL
ncbi:hypothetical protein [Psittacicella gerlachiana]|uniref:Uncharacterized protein n=1 Tax=Psittacicella gerlachiana TaxID=2028574 RepID=A0A3A1YCU6_9GAMM|nr:hypothetical protein [Psittacicella gerlachiana]RIY35008.1 hypothetical protein CKF59_04315 [Psittacicella gerlachiana]